MFRKILAVIIGYAIFVVSSLALFKFSGQKPHAQATILFQVVTAVYGLLFSLLSGYVLQLIAKSNNLNLNYILAIIIAGFAIFSFFKAEGSHWTQVMAIFLFTPMSIAGGYLYLRRNAHR